MTACLAIRVGGLRLRACSGAGGIRLPNADDPHHAFLCPDAEGEADAEIRLHSGTLPAEIPGPDLFRHRSQWRVRRHPAGGWALPLIFPPRQPCLHRLAVASEDFSRIDLFAPADDAHPGNPFAYLFAELVMIGLAAKRPLLLAHSSSIVSERGAFLALGRSGAGKSTLARLARGNGWTVLGDEMHLVTPGDEAGRFRIHGTPWPGSSGDFANASADVRGILLLEHGAENRLERVVGARAAAEVLSHVFFPAWSAAGMRSASDLAARLAESLPIFRFAFLPDATAPAFLGSCGA